MQHPTGPFPPSQRVGFDDFPLWVRSFFIKSNPITLGAIEDDSNNNGILLGDNDEDILFVTSRFTLGHCRFGNTEM